MAEKAQQVWYKVTLSYLAVIGVIVTHGIGCATAQELRDAIPAFQLTLSRYLVRVPTFFLALRITNKKAAVKTEHVGSVVVLAVISIIYNITYYGANTFISLTEANGVMTVASIVTSYVVHGCIFHQRLTPLQFLSAALATFATLLIVQPRWLFPSRVTTPAATAAVATAAVVHNTSTPINATLSSAPARLVLLGPTYDELVGYIWGVAGGVSFAILLDFMSVYLTEVEALVQVAHISWLGAIGTFVAIFYVEPLISVFSWRVLGLGLAHCVATTASFFLTAYSAHEIGTVRSTVVNSFQILLMFLLEHVWYDAIPGSGNWKEIVGCVLLVIGACMVPVKDIVREWSGASVL